MSTESQLKGDSLRRQTELSAEYAVQHDLQLVDDLELRDIGVSAFKGDNAATGALSRFLDAVAAGKVAAGSYLLVESLDRLSRDKVTAAMRLFLGITESGINIVTLSDGQIYRGGDTDFIQLVQSLTIMSRANEESRIKSQRVGAAWKNKRDHATTRKLTSMAPNWLQLSSDRTQFTVIEDRATVVRRIYQMANEGHGVFSITRTLNQNAVPAFGRSNGWNDSYVEKILKNRAVLGEYQPHSLAEGNRRPVGDPIADYYPRVIEEDLFLAVQADRRKRANSGGGRKGEAVKNLFTHIATCGYCGAPMRMVDKGKGPKGGRYLKCSASVRGLGCATKGWRYDDFEISFLFVAKEVDLAGVLNAEIANKVAADLDQRLSAAQEKLTRLLVQQERFAELVGDPTVGMDFIRIKLSQTQADLSETGIVIDQLKGERDALGNPPEADAADIRRLIDELKGMKGTAAYDQRTRLANRLRSIVVSLTVSTEGEKPRLAKTKQFLEDNEPDPIFRQALLDHIAEVSVAAQRYNPSFKVTFADGVIRQATVTEKDPMKYVNESVVRLGGEVHVEVLGRSIYPPAKPSLADS